MGSKKKKGKKDNYFLYRLNEIPENLDAFLDAFAEVLEEVILKDKQLFGDNKVTITKEVQDYVWEDLDDYERGKGEIVRKELNYKIDINLVQGGPLQGIKVKPQDANFLIITLNFKLLFIEVVDVLELQYDFSIEEGPSGMKMAVKIIRTSFKKRFEKKLNNFKKRFEKMLVQVLEEYSPT